MEPDIAVVVNIADEKKFLENPYAAPSAGGTNASAATNGNLATFIDHMSEADLVREKIKDGDEDEDSLPAATKTEPQKPYIHDPNAGAGGGFDQRRSRSIRQSARLISD